MSGPSADNPSDAPSQPPQNAALYGTEADWDGIFEDTSQPSPKSSHVAPLKPVSAPPLMLVETAFLASTASLLWLAGYYLNLVPWMRIIFPAPLALVYLRWGARAAWMSLAVTGLLLSVLMGPYLSLLFLVPYGLLGVQLGALWRRGAGWLTSISIGTIVATLGLFFRLWILSVFLDEDVWAYLTGRIADLVQWIQARLVGLGLLGVGSLGAVDLSLVQALTILAILLSDVVYLFTVHLAAWLLLQRLGNPIPEPPEWVQVLLEEER